MRRIEQISNKTRKSNAVTVVMILAMLLLMAGCQTSVKEEERVQTAQVSGEAAGDGETETLSPEQDEKDAEGEELSALQDQQDAAMENPMEIGMSDVENMAAGGELYALTDIIGEMDFYQQMNENLKETMTVDEEVYGIPGDLYGMGLMYRTDLFEQAGLVDEDGVPLKPADWEELAEYAAVLKEKTGAGLAFPGGDMAGTWQFMNIAAAFGVSDFTTVDQEGNIKAALDSEKMKQALTYLASLRWQYDCLADSAAEANMMTGYEELANGKAAMYIGANDALSILEDYNMDTEVLGIWGLPKGEDGRVHTVSNGIVYAFSASASREEVQQSIAKLQEEGLIAGENAFPFNGNVKYAGDYVDTMTEAVLEVMKNMPNNTNSEFYQILTDVIQNVLSDENADIDALLQAANESYDKVLAVVE